MKRLFNYLFLEFKKSIMVMKQSIIGLLIMIGFLTIGVTAVSYGLLQSQVFHKVNVAVTIPESETEVKLVTRYISNLESVKNICDFYYYDESKAWDEMEKGNIQAVITFPPEFFHDVFVGKNTPADIYFKETNDVNVLVLRELIKTAVSYLQISESGVYASLSFGNNQKTLIEKNELGNYVAKLYAEQLLKREKTFNKEVVSVFGMYQLEEYYFSVVILTILLMSGLQFGYLYQKKNKIIIQKLKIEGIGPIMVSIVRVLVMASILWIIALGLLLLTNLITNIMNYDLIHLRIGIIFSLFLLCISLASYFHGIYSLSTDSMNGTLLLLMMNLFIIVCSGILIPSPYLPDWIIKIDEISPFFIWNNFCNSFLFGDISITICFQMILMSILGTGIGMVALWKST